LITLLLCGALSHMPCTHGDDIGQYVAARAAMVDHLEDYAQAVGISQAGLDPVVMTAMRQVPRHLFVPAWLRDQAYENQPLPIGQGQTISQPYIVALMTDLLDVDSDDVVLEVGTGSGYQAAVLAEIVKHVYTIEIVEPLAKEAAERLAQLGYDNVSTRIGDGYHGWEQHAPFNAIMVTAGAENVPPPLVRQLSPRGKMIIPVNSMPFAQQLVLVEKLPSGAVETRQLLPVRFVPLTGDH
jgi:protein-L-isoaspartate(D-aspartate) O-methyltransferase